MMPSSSKNKMTSGDNYLRISSLRYLPRWMVFLIDVCILFVSLGTAFFILNNLQTSKTFHFPLKKYKISVILKKTTR